MTEEQEKQEGQKTLVAFVAGLLVGGLLVWVFVSSPENNVATPEDEVSGEVALETAKDEASKESGEDAIKVETAAEEKPILKTGNAAASVKGKTAGLVIELDSATFPTAEGWIGVRSFPNGQIGSILGAARYSESQGLIPTEIELLVPTIAGRTYAVTFFSEDGDRKFNPAYDVQLDTEITTFVAQ